MNNNCTCTDPTTCPYAFETHTNKIVCQKPKGMEQPKPSHYDTPIDVYDFALANNLDALQFDAIKRITRCRRKGQLLDDIDKTILVLHRMKEEYKKQGLI